MLWIGVWMACSCNYAISCCAMGNVVKITTIIKQSWAEQSHDLWFVSFSFCFYMIFFFNGRFTYSTKKRAGNTVYLTPKLLLNNMGDYHGFFKQELILQWEVWWHFKRSSAHKKKLWSFHLPTSPSVWCTKAEFLDHRTGKINREIYKLKNALKILPFS